MKNGAVIIGRFNPPTVGHYNLISKVKSFIVKHRHDHLLDPTVFIIVVAGEKSSMNKSINPLTASERVSLLSRNTICEGCKFIICQNVVEGFNKMREIGFEPTLIGGGEDRVSGYIELLQDYNPNHNYIELKMKRNNVDPNKSPNILDLLEPTDFNLMSASLARYAVKNNNLEAFKTITGLDGAQASNLFQKIKERMDENAKS